MDLTDRSPDTTSHAATNATSHQVSAPNRAGDRVLARALSLARWTIFWERLWPALASIATVVGLFLAVSWLGLWLWLPPIGRAIGLGVVFLLTAAAFAPLFMVRIPSVRTGVRLPSRTTSPHPPRMHSRWRSGARMWSARYALPRRSKPACRCRAS